MSDQSSEDKRIEQEQFLSQLASNLIKLPGFFEKIEKISSALSAPLLKIQIPNILEKISTISEGLVKSHRLRNMHYPAMVDELDYLASKSWFFSVLLPLSDLEKNIWYSCSVENSDTKESVLEKYYSDFFRENMECLVTTLIEEFPEREFAIRPAYSAHLRGEYALSIPVFFSQADGIIYKVTNKELFTSNNNISNLAKSQLVDESIKEPSWMDLFGNVAWLPVSVKRPIAWVAKDRKDNSYSGLNRNTVLHGIDLDYATEVNSYKAFSLLFYAAGLQGMMEDIESISDHLN